MGPDPLTAPWPARRPVLVLLAVVLLQTLPTLGRRDHWAFDEVRHAAALRELREGGHWLSLHVNGRPYEDKPPVWFWLVAGAATLVGDDTPVPFDLASAFGGFVFLLGTWALARTTVARGRPDLALLAPLLVTVTPLWQVLLRTTRMDLLFSGLIVLSFAALGRGVRPGGARGLVVGGLALAGLAGLVKGPVGLALPIGALVVHLVASRRARRLLAGDVLLGLLAAGLLVGAWAAGLAWVEGWGYLRDLVRRQVLGRALGDHGHTQGPWFYLAVLPAAWIPWTLFAVGGRWRAVVAWFRAAPAGTPRPDDGRGWLLATFLTGFVLLSLAGGKLFVYVMPLLGPLAVLTAVGLDALAPTAARRAWVALAAACVVLGAALPFAGRLVPWPEVEVHALLPTGLLFAATGLLVLAWRGREMPVALVGLGAALVVAAGWVAPSFDPVMSPRRQAEALADLAARGWAPMVYKVYRGAYTWHAGRILPETREADVLRAHLAAHDRVVVATPRSRWEAERDLFEGFVEVQAQRIEGRPFVLLARPAPSAEGGP